MLPTLIAATLAACFSQVPSLPVRTDSAGVEIVINSSVDRPLSWAYNVRLRLGGSANGPEMFSEVDRRVVGADSVLVLETDAAPTRSTQFQGCGFPLPSTRPLIFAKTLAWYGNEQWLAVSRDAAYVVDVYQGSPPMLVRSVRREIAPRRASYDLAVEWARENPVIIRRVDGDCVTPPREVAEKTGHVDRVPTIREVRVAPDGTLFVRRYAIRASAGQIDVFDDKGVYSGTLPADFLWPIGFLPGGEVLSAERDEMGVQRLVVAELTRH